MLNWIVWNRTDYLSENGFGIKQPTKVDMPLNQTTNQINRYYIEVYWKVLLRSQDGSVLLLIRIL